MTEADDLHLLSGAYALDALDDDERMLFEDYLEESQQLRTEVAELSETAMMLGISTRPATPTPQLKANVMALIASTPQLAPDRLRGMPSASPSAAPSMEQERVIRSIAAGDGAPYSADEADEADQIRSTPAEARAAARWYRKPLNFVVAAAAAVALLAGGTAIGAGLANDPADQQAQAQAQGLVELTAAGDLQQTASPVAGGGEAKLLWSDDLGRSAVLVDGLPALETDQTYQLWYIDGAGATSAGTFEASAGDSPSWRVLEGELSGDVTIGMTVEPEGGSSAPTTEPILAVQV